MKKLSEALATAHQVVSGLERVYGALADIRFALWEAKAYLDAAPEREATIAAAAREEQRAACAANIRSLVIVSRPTASRDEDDGVARGIELCLRAVEDAPLTRTPISTGASALRAALIELAPAIALLARDTRHSAHMLETLVAGEKLMLKALLMTNDLKLNKE